MSPVHKVLLPCRGQQFCPNSDEGLANGVDSDYEGEEGRRSALEEMNAENTEDTEPDADDDDNLYSYPTEFIYLHLESSKCNIISKIDTRATCTLKETFLCLRFLNQLLKFSTSFKRDNSGGDDGAPFIAVWICTIPLSRQLRRASSPKFGSTAVGRRSPWAFERSEKGARRSTRRRREYALLVWLLRGLQAREPAVSLSDLELETWVVSESIRRITGMVERGDMRGERQEGKAYSRANCGAK
ncbi:hypothetical protein B0H19DRAFT_1083048 [Mycena capillaripes]|nr:hypothetical protein B0H19DRAFT_1083048 [Mycena capillaripes]